ncbi:MAG TPA: ECF-type sigma factor [Bryobacteraceae bacterium]|nr:ECF-type sigma factor [Bryobacteraceae bacterium]
MPETEQITVLLQEFSDGDKDALDRLMPLVYAELRRLANSLLHRESNARTLQPTALVHEAYARLAGQANPPFASRSHFLSIAAKVMRQILTDYARRRKTSKRGAGLHKTCLEEALSAAIEEPAIMVALSDALDELEKKDPRKAALVEMRYFGGLTLAEAAEVTGLTVNVIRYELRIAQAWLHRELNLGATSLHSDNPPGG